ncbi:concanavalin A-like lectin/glucanase domain-containing protein [Crassisporium funariophilum]|nr:concanavalin A-like lectin/glucanase domain-containing protein [Crassisporium funariophilum]
MAYPRRQSGSHIRKSALQEAPDPESSLALALAPPRPFFLADSSSTGNRSSVSSIDNTSLDPASASDSDRDPEPVSAPTTRAPAAPRSTAVPARAALHTHHNRRRSSGFTPSPVVAPSGQGYAQVDLASPKDENGTWTPTSLYDSPPASSSLFTHQQQQQQQQQLPTRPPPSSFAFPFQAYPGNPDPGLAIPGSLSRRRSSLDSSSSPNNNNNRMSHPSSSENGSAEVMYHPLSHSGSLTDLRKPNAPFMAGGEAGSSTGSLPRSNSSSSLYRGSVAANMMLTAADSAPNTPNLGHSFGHQQQAIPRTSSTHSFRAPFLAPSSRPGSTLWAPPSYNTQLVSYTQSPNGSTTALGLPPSSPFAAAAAISKIKTPLPSTRLAAPIAKADKPWLQTHEPRTRRSYALTCLFLFLGLAAAAILCFTGVKSVRLLPDSALCLVMSDDFSAGALSADNWTPEVELGGFGNGEFQMTTAESDNLYVNGDNQQLYLHPTLTTEKVQGVLDGGNFTLDGCTSGNRTACSVSSSSARGTVINPVMSARIGTKGKKSIKFGKVEVRAKLPRGCRLALAPHLPPPLLPNLRPPPLSGSISLLSSRGNPPTYPAQGRNFVRSSLSYGPLPSLVREVYGWYSTKRGGFDEGWHVYVMEWDEGWVRFWTDSRLKAMLEVDTGGKSMWDRAGFPGVARNGSAGAQVVIQNPYAQSSPMAPFDQDFYLLIDLAAGGTNGWFPDGDGGKPWFDGSITAMRDFARAQDTWSATWPSSADDRAFRIDYVKMWTKC